MAALTRPHWDRVTPSLRQVLTGIGQFPFMRRFYLAGGTAATLQLGHRVSVDLDFFSATDELG
ncbi:MAG: nucleotidyl transferase AbiEii/AbiGii toxin family protein, partial [Anaerolineae bacterium]